MSIENLKEYTRRCATEEDLLMRAKEIGMSDLDSHMSLAGSLGLEWSMDDMVAFRKELLDLDEDLGPLDEEELQRIAGGVGPLAPAPSHPAVASAAASAAAGSGQSEW